jgi:major type 1 subunit fimbrin (pilin)
MMSAYSNDLRRGSVLVRVLALISLMMGSTSAWATCSGGNQTFTLNLPSSVSVPRDAPNGTLLTPFVESAAIPNLWRCDWPASEWYGVRAQVAPAFSTNSGQTYSDGNGTYTVWNTNVPGVGIAIRRNLYVDTTTCEWHGGWRGWGNIAGSWLGIACGPPFHAHSGNAGAQVAVALVKTGTVSAGGTIGGTVAQVAPVDGNTLPGLANNYSITNVAIIPMLCTTPDVLVDLGRHVASSFTNGIGSVTPAIGFDVRLTGCSAGLVRIRYRVDAMTAILNSSQSVVALDGSSSATGVGVQLLDGNGAVFPLATYRTLSGYSAAAGGDYAVALKARYFQTGATVGPGPANTSMTFTMSYE